LDPEEGAVRPRARLPMELLLHGYRLLVVARSRRPETAILSSAIDGLQADSSHLALVASLLPPYVAQSLYASVEMSQTVCFCL
jgi:hypothetical protein